MSVLKMADSAAVRPIERVACSPVGARSFSFIALILAHARARTRATLCGGRAYLQRAPALFISRILALLQIRKKKRASAPVLWPTISNYSASFPPFHPPRAPHPPVPLPKGGVCGKKVRPRWVVAEIGAARTSIRNEDGKCVVTTESFLIYSLYSAEPPFTIERSARTKGMTQGSDKFCKNRVDTAAPCIYDTFVSERLNCPFETRHST